ncbi:MAG: DUF1009 domain-containing protein [Deltaproteobacteria bacterium]|nr:MAG: DUF1009 domain-containing protein [Deltaproteobacteria bacterium]
MSKVGIIAGAGEFPIILVRKCLQKGLSPVVVAISEEASPVLDEVVDGVFWQSVGKVGKIFKHLRKEGVTEAIVAGKVHKMRIFRDFQPDLTAMRLLWSLRNRKDDTIMNKVADALAEEGITLIPQTTFMEDYIPRAKVFTKRKPTDDERVDIDFGASVATEMGRLDIGQTVVVKRGAVMAIEAIEGTDQAILRGGSLGNRDVVVVKVAKPDQDQRFDIPAIGLGTVKACLDGGARVLAFEAGKTFFFQQEEAVEMADRNDMSIVAF